jgi:hypothetical protein
MKVRRFCACGVKLERDVCDEDTARLLVMTFWREHCGAGHGIINSKQYEKLIQNIIKRNFERKQKPQLHNSNQLGLRAFRVIKGGR